MAVSKPDILVNLVDSQGSAVGITDGLLDVSPTVADGNDVALGSTTDEAIEGDEKGTISAKLRGINKTLVSALARSARFGAPGSPTTEVVTVQGTPWMTPVAVSAGGYTVTPTATPVITAGAYAAGQLIGGLLQLRNAVRGEGGSGIIQSVTVSDKAKQSTWMDVIFFTSKPAYTTFTDTAALDIHDTDLLYTLKPVPVFASDWHDFANNSVGGKFGIGLPFKLARGTTLYACLVAREAGTYASTGDLQLTAALLGD